MGLYILPACLFSKALQKNRSPGIDFELTIDSMLDAGYWMLDARHSAYMRRALRAQEHKGVRAQSAEVKGQG